MKATKMHALVLYAFIWSPFG